MLSRILKYNMFSFSILIAAIEINPNHLTAMPLQNPHKRLVRLMKIDSKLFGKTTGTVFISMSMFRIFFVCLNQPCHTNFVTYINQGSGILESGHLELIRVGSVGSLVSLTVLVTATKFLSNALTQACNKFSQPGKPYCFHR